MPARPPAEPRPGICVIPSLVITQKNGAVKTKSISSRSKTTAVSSSAILPKKRSRKKNDYFDPDSDEASPSEKVAPKNDQPDAKEDWQAFKKRKKQEKLEQKANEKR